MLQKDALQVFSERMGEQRPLQTHNLQQQKLKVRGVTRHRVPGVRHGTWSGAWGGHVVNEILQRCADGDEGMVHGGVLLVGHPVVVMVVGPGTAGPQPPVIVANIEHQDQQEAEQTHWASNYRCEGNGAERGGCFWRGNCRTQRRHRHGVDQEIRWRERLKQKNKVISVQEIDWGHHLWEGLALACWWLASGRDTVVATSQEANWPSGAGEHSICSADRQFGLQ